MKKLIVSLMVAGVLTLGFSLSTFAQGQGDTTQTEAAAPETTAPASTADQNATTDEGTPSDQPMSFHQIVKEQFIAGGWQFMSIILACLIIGLAIAIERIITLNLATTNTKKLLARVDEAISRDGVEGAKEVCKNTKGPLPPFLPKAC